MYEVEERNLSEYLSYIDEEIYDPRSKLLENSSSPGEKEESQEDGMSEESQ